MPGVNPTVESSKLGQPSGDTLKCPKSLGAGMWAYERLKRSTEKVRIEAEFAIAYDREREFSKFKDWLNRDTLLTCAVVKVEDSACAVTFGNGSVVTFKSIRST